MRHYYLAGRWAGITAGLLLAALAGRAQAPVWSLATRLGIPQAGGNARVASMVTDASGNLLVTGSFEGQLALGGTTLTSVGSTDWFVGKYAPGSGTWAWAQSGGGAGYDFAYDLAVSGTNVYVVGSIINNTANTQGVLFGGTGPGSSTVRVNGATVASTDDLLLLKLTDNGTTASLTWAQVGGGTGFDYATGVAVSGSSVYVLGIYNNSRTNDLGVVLGGNGTTAGTTTVLGVTSDLMGGDLLLAKYTDGGSTGSLGWTQVAGGTGTEISRKVVAQGSAVYISGGMTGASGTGGGAVFGGNGTTAGTSLQYGATTTFGPDLLLARYTDNGPTGTYNWSQVGGGTDYDYATGVAVSGSSVYLIGGVYNSQANARGVLFGGSGTTAGTSPQAGATTTVSQDIILAKYTDNGSSGTFRWSQVAGGTSDEYPTSVAVRNNGVYLTGILYNSRTNANGVLLGGSGPTAGTTTVNGLSAQATYDVLVARYQDAGGSGTLSWAQAGGGDAGDGGTALVLTGQSVYVAASVQPPATFGSLTLASTGSSPNGELALVRLTDTTLPTRPAGAGPALALYPNPSGGAATLTGAAPGAVVQVLDALGRVAATTTADAAGAARLAGLAPGLYLVRAGATATRLAVE